MVRRSHRRSPLALAVLGLLYEAPMHPYRMQQLIKERGKDEVINVRERASIYQAIDRLQREGLVTVVQTARDEKRPERTVYQLTEEGRETTNKRRARAHFTAFDRTAPTAYARTRPTCLPTHARPLLPALTLRHGRSLPFAASARSTKPYFARVRRW